MKSYAAAKVISICIALSEVDLLNIHNLTKDGRMEVEMFEHFRMELTGIFSSAERRKANEGVRIAHLDPNTRMNSKDEFRQGTNIIMQPVRGIGA